jgi:hypothetical protein
MEENVITDCFPPPLSAADISSNITVVATPDGLDRYPFGTTVTYLCPPGRVFIESILGYLTATCAGAYGWKRPYRLVCTGKQWIMVPHLFFMVT